MQNLMKCIPRGLVNSITSDEEVSLIFLQRLWSQIVGEELARNSQPASLNRRILCVRVPTELWLEHLGGFSSMVIASVNRFWGVPLVETIKWEIGLMKES
jgi:predicted nucleic acid-binding Zn ribbon protein